MSPYQLFCAFRGGAKSQCPGLEDLVQIFSCFEGYTSPPFSLYITSHDIEMCKFSLVTSLPPSLPPTHKKYYFI